MKNLALAIMATIALGTSANSAAAQSADKVDVPATAPDDNATPKTQSTDITTNAPIDHSSEEESCTADGSCSIQRTRVFVVMGGEGEKSSTDLDSDGDGIPDSRDKCVNEPENYNGFKDGDGCPDVPVENWHFGINAGGSFLWHKEFNYFVYGAGAHLRWTPGKHEGRLAGMAGGCQTPLGTDVSLSATLSYAYRVAKPLRLGLGIRGTSCYDWWAPKQENQVLRTFGGGLVVGIGPVRGFVDLASFARFRPGQKRQMGLAPMVSLEADLDFLHW